MKSFIGMLILFVGCLISSLIYDKMRVLSIVIFGVSIFLWLLVMIFMKNKKTEMDEKDDIKYRKKEDKIVTSVVENKSKDRYTDKELDKYELDDLQKELVNKGEFEPFNFEEEDLEEDDYYFDDDNDE